EGNAIEIFTNQGGGAFARSAQLTPGTHPHTLTALDLDGDGALDLAVANWDSFDFMIFVNNGSGSFAPPATYATGGRNTRWLAFGDLDGDGRLDATFVDYTTTEVGVFRGAANAMFSFHSRYYAGGQVDGVVLGDFNRDGRPDVALALDDPTGAIGAT